MTFGGPTFGIGAFGDSSTAGIVYAYAASTHDVVVLLGSLPQARSAALDGDALNPSTWAVLSITTNELIPIASVQVYGKQVTIRTVAPLPTSDLAGRVLALTLNAAVGGLMQLPRQADFLGVTEVVESTPTQVIAHRTKVRDLKNLPAPSGANGGALSGTFVLQGGDYVNELGKNLLRKILVRRMTSRPGDFFHLPNFGLNVGLKEPISGGDLVRLQAAAEKQATQEDDVKSAKVQIVQRAGGLTIISLAAVMRSTNETVTASTTIRIGA